jgi:hypothetical protein
MIHPITVVIFLLVVFFAAGLAMLWLSEKASRWIRIRRVRVQLEKELSIEEARQAALPKLDTRYLIRMPDWAVLKYYGAEDHHPRKAFGTRYSNLIVFDEVGDVWLGLFMPATLQSLRDCEYSRGEYWVWFRGGGEAYSGTPLTLNGVQIWSYPVWMDPFDAHIDSCRCLLSNTAPSYELFLRLLRGCRCLRLHRIDRGTRPLSKKTYRNSI